ncbi:efflux RND transporter permease subunit [Pacificimonas sp. WHA3]|uniref:Efflux RND transporter permease subunit n=1 Tax=Pacificimonas pallii TaxID=2827236 RepID=A0ABS6SEA1_9SPHN|nr:efflux RND transporter permease subunit [Pacificimonas pallii]MBV7256714.1 efflux RND transporter permease subunit [Pacificimonas pallii]
MTGFAVRRWQLTLIIASLFAFLGMSALFTIPRTVDPHFDIPFIIVIASQPGADATDMEQTVAKPIEQALIQLDDVVEVSSNSADGLATIQVEFSWGVDSDEKYNDVIREVSAIRDRLPEGLADIEYRQARTTQSVLMQYALVSETASWKRMQKYAEDLQELMLRVEGVRQADVFGVADPEVRVAIDAARLSEYRIPSTAVAGAISQGGVDLPAGIVHSGEQRLNVDAGGAYRGLDEVGAVPLRAEGGAVVTIADVADVSWATDERLHIVRYNDERAVIVAAQQKNNVNGLTVQAGLEEAIEGFRAALPPDMRLEKAYDQTEEINDRMGMLLRDFGIALSLVLITLLPLGPRASGIVMVSIPLSLATGLFCMWLIGHSLNQLSIAGFILSLGLLVDDSIVVTENISRHLRMGKARLTAALDGTREIAAAVFGSTFVLIFAFLPLIFLPGGAGVFTRTLPLATLFTVSASLIISLTIIPFIASRVLKRDDDPEGNAIMRFVSRGIHKVYRPILHRALDHPRRWFVATMAICLAAFALIPQIGFALFPDADVPHFLVEIRAPEGTSVAGTDRIVRHISEEIAKEDGIRTRVDNAGAGGPQVFYNVFTNFERTREGNVLVVQKEWDADETPALIERLRTKFADYPEAEINVRTFTNGVPVEAPVEFFVVGPDLDIIKRISGQVEGKLRANPAIRDINNPLKVERTDLNIGLDAPKAALLGVAPGSPRRVIRLALVGERAGTFRDSEGDPYPVVVRLPMDERRMVSALDDIYLPTTAGGSVPLGQVATPYLESVPPRVDRYQQERTNSITAFVRTGYNENRVMGELFEELQQMELPAGYQIVPGGVIQATEESFGGLGPIIAFAMLGMLAVLIAEFGNFRETIVVAGVVPLGMFGGIIALFITGFPISFTGVIGFVAMVGIEIKNSILLVDFTRQLRDRGLPLREAVEQAGEIRFLPVLLTSVTAVGGLLPLALSGTALYAPLAWVIIGGLISSTILSRIVTPVMYLLVARAVAPARSGPESPDAAHLETSG